MLLHLRRKLFPLLRAASHPIPTAAELPRSSCLRAAFALLFTSEKLLFCHHLQEYSTSPTTAFSVEEYLVDACGLTRAQALAASRKLPDGLGPPSNPDAVLALLAGAGLSGPDIAAAVASDPPLLLARARDIGPRLASLSDRLGLSAPQVARFLRSGGGAAALRSGDDLAPKLEFWIPLFGSFDSLLLTAARNIHFLNINLDNVGCKIDFFRTTLGCPEYSFSDAVRKYPHILGFSEAVIRSKILFLSTTLGCSEDKVTDVARRFPHVLGLSQQKLRSRIDLLRSQGLHKFEDKFIAAVCRNARLLELSEETLRRKIEFLRTTLCCPEDEFSSVFYRRPNILQLSEEKLQRNIEFMVSEVGLELENIMRRPQLLSYSLEKRLVPRHCVVKILQAKGLLKEGDGFCQFIEVSEKDFTRKIGCYVDVVPGIIDAYAAAQAGELPSPPRSMLHQWNGKR